MEVIFYAPLGRKISPHMRGGAESGCNKTLHIYQSAGVKVHIVEKAANEGNKLRYLLSTALVLLRFVAACLAHPKAVVHIVGFYGKIISIERLLVKTAKLLGHKVVYEMRNGGLVNIYRKSDEAYKRRQRDIWLSADGLLCQGESFADFIKAETGIQGLYFPNFIQGDVSTATPDERASAPLNLIYFGRLVEAKNIKTIIEIISIVHQSYPDAVLNLIGGISDDYKKEIDRYTRQLNLPAHCVKYHGHQPFGYIKEQLEQAHFFLFPSSEPNEGHSNSLTEAMGCGVVPIVSTAGFNARICGDDDLVIPTVDAQLFADRLIKIWEEGRWSEKSRRMSDRIRDNYTETIVGRRLIDYMKQILKK